ncbi:SRPBCC family protein [Cellulosimicrobium cellulans]|uniref:SRPBCC family protein n=1 Tax=Cellulosimicrobium cellulans TaxID=1710 RepID=UPI00364A56FB
MTETTENPEVEPTGSVVREADGRWIVLRRTFAAPVADVWASLTEPAGLEPWIGTWDGDPTTGSVRFVMTAEGATDGDECRVLRCDPPHRLVVETAVGETSWHLEVDLADDDGTTALVFRQALGPDEDAGSIGPGWEYYLDRLAAARAGRDPATVVWDSYYPALAAHYGSPDAPA